MIKKLLYIVILLAGIGCAVMLVKTHAIRQAFAPPPTQKVPAMPAMFAQIAMGMSESQVLALVGQPRDKSVYARYKHETPQYWASLDQQVANAPADQSAYDSVPDFTVMRAKALLTHRFHDIWWYRPTAAMTMVLYFNDDATLGNIGYRGTGKAPSEPPKRSATPSIGG